LRQKRHSTPVFERIHFGGLQVDDGDSSNNRNALWPRTTISSGRDPGAQQMLTKGELC
jgi:hypothetical protein